jgi:hypothetical protein
MAVILSGRYSEAGKTGRTSVDSLVQVLEAAGLNKDELRAADADTLEAGINALDALIARVGFAPAGPSNSLRP